MAPLDLDEIRDKWLAPCGACDAGLPMGCTHPEGDYRPVMLRLVAEVERVQTKLEDYRVRLVAAEADLLDVRGILSPNGEPERTPVPLAPTVAPAVQWLVAEVERLRDANANLIHNAAVLADEVIYAHAEPTGDTDD